jgi:hypothetical protein
MIQALWTAAPLFGQIAILGVLSVAIWYAFHWCWSWDQEEER